MGPGVRGSNHRRYSIYFISFSQLPTKVAPKRSANGIVTIFVPPNELQSRIKVKYIYILYEIYSTWIFLGCPSKTRFFRYKRSTPAAVPSQPSWQMRRWWPGEIPKLGATGATLLVNLQKTMENPWKSTISMAILMGFNGILWYFNGI